MEDLFGITHCRSPETVVLPALCLPMKCIFSFHSFDVVIVFSALLNVFSIFTSLVFSVFALIYFEIFQLLVHTLSLPQLFLSCLVVKTKDDEQTRDDERW